MKIETVTTMLNCGRSISSNCASFVADKPVLMTEYPSETKVQILHQALKEYDDTYDESIRSKGGQSKMKKIDKFFTGAPSTQKLLHGEWSSSFAERWDAIYVQGLHV